MADAPAPSRSNNAAWYWTKWFLMRFGSPIALFGLWEIAARNNLIDARVLPAPSKVAVTIWDMIQNDDLLRHTGITTLRFLVGMIVGTIPGVLLGITMGLFRPVRVALASAASRGMTIFPNF